jgi:hypothetical protein
MESDKEGYSEESNNEDGNDDNASTDANKNKNGKGDSGDGSDKDDSPIHKPQSLILLTLHYLQDNTAINSSVSTSYALNSWLIYIS